VACFKTVARDVSKLKNQATARDKFLMYDILNHSLVTRLSNNLFINEFKVLGGLTYCEQFIQGFLVVDLINQSQL
jgi:hypothetical protein